MVAKLITTEPGSSPNGVACIASSTPAVLHIAVARAATSSAMGARSPSQRHRAHGVFRRHELLTGDDAGPQQLVVQRVAGQPTNRPRLAVRHRFHVRVVERRHRPPELFHGVLERRQLIHRSPLIGERTLVDSTRPEPVPNYALRPCRRSLPAGTVTFLFSDIEDSTRLWEEMPAEMAAALEIHDGIVRATIERHGGYVFATGGDGFCAAFSTAPDAAEAAVEIQQQVARRAGRRPVRGADRSAHRRGDRAKSRLLRPGGEPRRAVDVDRPWRADRRVRHDRRCCCGIGWRCGRSATIDSAVSVGG